jgi:hypothetical protein
MPDRFRKRTSFFGRMMPNRLLAVLADYPFESLISVWGLLSGVSVFLGQSGSSSLGVLPEVLQLAWGVSMTLSGITIIVGLSQHLYDVVAAGLYLLSGVLVAYACAVVGFGGFVRGGLVALLVFFIGLIAFVRGWWLKTRDRLSAEEMKRTEGQ